MPKTLKMLMARLMNEADEGKDLPGDTVVLDDDYQPGTPEDRGDFLPGDNLDPEAPNAVASAADEDQDQGQPAQAAAAAKAQQDQEAEEAEEAAKANSGTVPHARFNEVNERRKAAEQESERLRAELEAMRAAQVAPQKAAQAQVDKEQDAPEFDVNAQEKAYLSALMDGNEEEAQKIRTGINQHLLEQATAKAVERVRAESEARERASAEQQAAKLLQETATAVVADYAFLDDPAHAEVLDMIEARRDALIAKGIPAHQALREAADFIAPRFAPEGFTPAKSGDSAQKKTDSRSAAAVERGAKASMAQPPVPAAGMGNRATGAEPLNLATMSDEQFERLTEAEKKRLRGD